VPALNGNLSETSKHTHKKRTRSLGIPLYQILLYLTGMNKKKFCRPELVQQNKTKQNKTKPASNKI
jgi:hypothetical protein